LTSKKLGYIDPFFMPPARGVIQTQVDSNSKRYVMYAVIKTGGKQHRVQEGDVLAVEKLAGEKGQEIVFEEVLLVGKDDEVLVGQPRVCGAQVTGEILSQFQGPKITVFKMKRRKGYKKKTGHRQELTRLVIRKISV
jgi:large subunit ribosomal protein L21